MSKKKIVILGAGFGGVYTYKSIPSWLRKKCHITIIDKKNHFLFTPLLPEVATGGLDQHNVVEPIRDIINASVNFIKASVSSVDTKNKMVHIEDAEISYDILVSALGSETHFFDIPGALEYSYVLKTLEDSIAIRNRFIDIFEAASQLSNQAERSKMLSLVIVGGGPTGVELAGEAADLFFQTFDKQYKNISAKDISITLINSSDSLVSMFDTKLQKYAKASLIKNKVQVKNNSRVTEIHERGVIMDDGQSIPTQTVIWAAGVKPKVLRCIHDGFNIQNGKICVNQYLQAEHNENVFVVGDMSHFPTKDERGLPMTAQVAKQQGQCVAKNIQCLLEAKDLHPFVYKEKGLLASLGLFDAIAQIKGIRLTGLFAWFLWRTIYLLNFASWKKRIRILLDWTIGLFTRRDTTRL